jgi:hypothetical protein
MGKNLKKKLETGSWRQIPEFGASAVTLCRMVHGFPGATRLNPASSL